MINTITLPPFKKMCVTIGNLPSSFVESMSYYEALCWMYNYLDKTVIPAINTEGEAITELQTAFVTLKNYVDNYFENLDVQEEINNKLDEMADSGELEEIIGQYINTNSVLGFNTINDLKNAENLINGSFVKTYGKNSLNDGGGQFYKIRTITSGDTVDEINIIALTQYPTLIAERMQIRDKMLIVGDSWSMPNYPYITNQNLMWFNQIAKELNLRVQTYAVSGAGYNVTNNRFRTQVENIIANENPLEIKKIIIFGGLNDLSTFNTSSNDLYTECNYILNQLKNNFPNSEITVIGINTPDGSYFSKSSKAKDQLNDATLINSYQFVDSIPFLLGYPTLFGENTNHHPNEAGQKFLAGCILSSMNGTYSRQIVKTSSPYTINKFADWYPDLTGDITYYEDRLKIDLNLNIVNQFSDTATLTFTIPDLSLKYSTNSLILRPEYSPANSFCVFINSTNETEIKIGVPANVTGNYKGYIEIPY